MGFNPFKEKGMPIEKQFKDWSSLNSKPYDPKEVDPYSRCRGILMNGIEVEAVLFYHQFSRHCDDMDLKRQLATVRRVEQQEQKMINWAIPAEESVLEVTIGYEQLAVDLTAAMAQAEPDKNVKAALDFGLIEDFDHLYRYSNLLQSLQDKPAAQITRDYTEIMPGRPTVVEHRHPFDELRLHYDKSKADALTKLHVATITAAEQQTMNFYMNVGNRIQDEIGRGLYQEIAQIEEQHVTQYGSLADPTASWFEMAVLHEYNECYMYYSCMSSEPDPRLKGVWQHGLENGLEHLRMAVEMWKRYEKVDATERFPTEFPALTVLKPAVAYVREIIASQISFVGDRQRIVPLSHAENGDRIKAYQRLVNTGDYVPSQQAVQNCINARGQDYRSELKGPAPVELLQSRTKLPSAEQLISYMAGR
jgi:rubrerythrin